MTIRQFLFGGGWWTIWYIGLWLMLPVCIYLLWWFSIIKPDSGPQGGELAAGLLRLGMIGFAIAVVALSAANFWMLARFRSRIP